MAQTLTLLNELSKLKKGPHLRESFLSTDPNSFDNQLSIALWHMTLIWHVSDTQWRLMSVSSITFVVLWLWGSDEGLWQLDTALFDDQMTEWGLDCWWPGPLTRLMPGPWHGPLSSYLGIISQPDTSVVIILCEREIWVKIVTIPPLLGPVLGYFAPNYPAVAEISCPLTKCDN